MTAENSVALDSDFETILVCAERYACGRRTYIVSDVVDYILKYLPLLSKKTLTVLMRDMESNFDMENRMPKSKVFGDDCDRKRWIKLYYACKDAIATNNG